MSLWNPFPLLMSIESLSLHFMCFAVCVQDMDLLLLSRHSRRQQRVDWDRWKWIIDGLKFRWQRQWDKKRNPHLIVISGAGVTFEEMSIVIIVGTFDIIGDHGVVRGAEIVIIPSFERRLWIDLMFGIIRALHLVVAVEDGEEDIMDKEGFQGIIAGKEVEWGVALSLHKRGLLPLDLCNRQQLAGVKCLLLVWLRWLEWIRMLGFIMDMTLPLMLHNNTRSNIVICTLSSTRDIIRILPQNDIYWQLSVCPYAKVNDERRWPFYYTELIPPFRTRTRPVRTRTRPVRTRSRFLLSFSQKYKKFFRAKKTPFVWTQYFNCTRWSHLTRQSSTNHAPLPPYTQPFHPYTHSSHPYTQSS